MYSATEGRFHSNVRISSTDSTVKTAFIIKESCFDPGSESFIVLEKTLKRGTATSHLLLLLLICVFFDVICESL